MPQAILRELHPPCNKWWMRMMSAAIVSLLCVVLLDYQTQAQMKVDVDPMMEDRYSGTRTPEEIFELFRDRKMNRLQGLQIAEAILEQTGLSNYREVRAGEPDGARLVRLLELPRRVEIFSNVLAWVGGGLAFGVLTAIFHDRGLGVVLAGTAVGFFASLFPGLMLVMLVEDDVRPVALAEFRRNPHVALPPRGFFWPRQRWYLPYAFGVALVSMVVFSSLVLAAKYETAVAKLVGSVERSASAQAAASPAMATAEPAPSVVTLTMRLLAESAM